MRGSGLALLRTATGIARLLASVLFGLVWTLTSLDTAIACFAGALVLAVALAALTLVRHPEVAHA
jgi:hypothetical protein